MVRRGKSTADGECSIFNADNGVVASMDPGWLQLALDLLTGMFDQMGLRTNVCNNIWMVFWPFQAARIRADKAYTRRM